jgi:hypothetical protein
MAATKMDELLKSFGELIDKASKTMAPEEFRLASEKSVQILDSAIRRSVFAKVATTGVTATQNFITGQIHHGPSCKRCGAVMDQRSHGLLQCQSCGDFDTPGLDAAIARKEAREAAPTQPGGGMEEETERAMETKHETLSAEREALEKEARKLMAEIWTSPEPIRTLKGIKESIIDFAADFAELRELAVMERTLENAVKLMCNFCESCFPRDLGCGVYRHTPFDKICRASKIHTAIAELKARRG